MIKFGTRKAGKGKKSRYYAFPRGSKRMKNFEGTHLSMRAGKWLNVKVQAENIPRFLCANVGITEHFLHLGTRFHPRFLHLLSHERTHHRDAADIMAGSCLHRHYIAYLQIETGGIGVEPDTGVLEQYLHN